MKTPTRTARAHLLAFAAASLALASASAPAQEAAIRKNLPERLPNLPKIEEVRAMPMAGLYEIRVNGSDIFYTDAQGNYVIQGNVIDAKARRNLTEERVEKLNAIQFDNLPLKDAFVVTRGDGKRRLAVFEDPNCGYCKRFERELQKVDNVTVYMFLYPILSPDSTEKSKAIWCTANKATAWQDLMVRDVAPIPASCDTSAVSRNIEFGRKHKITGTPTLIFADGSRAPGALTAPQVEKMLADAKN